jgi:hypothetical protein
VQPQPPSKATAAATIKKTHLGRHAGLGGTPALAVARVAALALGRIVEPHPHARVDPGRLLHDQSLAGKLPDALACRVPD